MSYETINIPQLFDATRAGKTLGDPIAMAIAWLEAENIFVVREIICKWFDLMQSGEAENHYPDPKGLKIGQARADKLIEELDTDFQQEYARFPGRDHENGPAYSRLCPHARLAFAQEIFAALKDEAALEKEAHTRLNAGEIIPPSNAVSAYNDG